METILLAGFILGLTSNLHCIGMCGPIAMAIPVNRKSNLTILSGILQYNSGRIFTYSILGAIVGSIGVTVVTFGILQWISIAAGVFMILFAWRKWISARLDAKLPVFGIQGFVSKGLGKVIASRSPFKLTLLGSLNGMLPCGMVYVALMNALLGGNPLSSAYAMIAFGVGTLPAMIAVGFAANRISTSVRQKLNKAVPFMLTIVGVLIVLRGMNLNIPYISPKVSVTKTETRSIEKEKAPQVEMSCCHKKNSCSK
jgi:sulfite exporter TauE/SafE